MSSILNRGINTDPETLDPHKARSLQAADILREIGEGLVTYTATGELTPGVAASWDISDDGLTYTFRLRPDAKWSNGDSVVAEHFVFAVKRLRDPGTAAFYAAYLADVTGIEAQNDQTLVVALAQPTACRIAGQIVGLNRPPGTLPQHDRAPVRERPARLHPQCEAPGVNREP